MDSQAKQQDYLSTRLYPKRMSDEELVATYMAISKAAWHAERNRMHRKFLNKRDRVQAEMARRGDRIKPLISIYLDSADPDHQYTACYLCRDVEPVRTRAVVERLFVDQPEGLGLYAHIAALTMSMAESGSLSRTWDELYEERLDRYSAEVRARNEALQALHGPDVLKPPPEVTDEDWAAYLEHPPELHRIQYSSGWKNDAANYRFIKADRGAFLLLDRYMDDGSDDATTALEFWSLGDYVFRYLSGDDEAERALFEAKDREIYGTYQGWIGELRYSQLLKQSRPFYPGELQRHFVIPFNTESFECKAKGYVESRSRLLIHDALVETTQELARRDRLPYAEWMEWNNSRWKELEAAGKIL